jgi:hypothetical protein
MLCHGATTNYMLIGLVSGVGKKERKQPNEWIITIAKARG